jgi:hypothetical protein
MFGVFTLIAAAFFAGAAVYVSVAEHPARLSLDDAAALGQWKFGYQRGALMQATLALVGFVLGVLEWLVTGSSVWLAGSLVMMANLAYTLIWIMPINDALKEWPAEQAGPASRSDLERWGRLHAARSVLSVLATAIFAWALL